MNDPWVMQARDRFLSGNISVASGDDGKKTCGLAHSKVEVTIDSGPCAGVGLTDIEACRLAVELLRRSGRISMSVINLVDECLPP